MAYIKDLLKMTEKEMDAAISETEARIKDLNARVDSSKNDYVHSCKYCEEADEEGPARCEILSKLYCKIGPCRYQEAAE